MASADLHKVCFPIVGRPAIVRAIDAYKAAGLRRFLIVVGQKAAQVIAAVSQAHPEVSFVYQIDPPPSPPKPWLHKVTPARQ